MGWSGIHLFQFNIRGIMHAGPYLHGPSGVDVPLSDFRLRQTGKFRYVYDMNCWWDHELRIEDRVPAIRGKSFIPVASAELVPARRRTAVALMVTSQPAKMLSALMP